MWQSSSVLRNRYRFVLNFQVDPDTALKRHLESKESHISDTVGVERSFLVDLEQAYDKVFPSDSNVRSISGYSEASITHRLVRQLVTDKS